MPQWAGAFHRSPPLSQMGELPELASPDMTAGTPAAHMRWIPRPRPVVVAAAETHTHLLRASSQTTTKLGVVANTMDSTRAPSNADTGSTSDMTLYARDHQQVGITTNQKLDHDGGRKGSSSSSSDKEEEEDQEALSNAAWTVRDWLTVIGGFAAVTATGGSVTSIGLLQTHWTHHQLRAYSPRDVGWISGTNICLTLFLPVLAGPVFDRRGHLWLLVSGSTLFVVGLFLMSFLDEGTASTPPVTFGALLLTWGMLCGAGNGLVSTAVTGVLCRRFNRRRGFACGLSSMGSSVGGVVWPLLLRDTLSHWGWGWAIRLLAGASVALLVFGALFISNSPGHRRPSVASSASSSSDDEIEMEKRLATTLKDCVFDGARCFSKVDFVLMTASLAIFQFVVMGIVGTLPSWGKLQGFDMALLFNVVAVMNTGSCAGRVAVGALSDRIGSFNSAIICKVFYTIVIFGIMLNIEHMVWRLYVFAALWGFFYGAVLSMMSVLTRELSGAASFGRYLSASSSIISIAGFICVPLSAQMLASFGPQNHVIFLGVLCSVSMILMTLSRWSLLSYKWKWAAKV